MNKNANLIFWARKTATREIVLVRDFWPGTGQRSQKKKQLEGGRGGGGGGRGVS